MSIWNFIHAKLKSNIPIVLMVVIDSHGSSPGRKGFKMAVAEDGDLNGSVGGGLMEYKLVELAKKQFINPKNIFLKRQNHNTSNENESSGMICSGSQLIAFYFLDETHFPLIKSISIATKGTLVFDESGIGIDHQIQTSDKFGLNFINDNKWKFTEQLGFKNHLFIFGGGHVSLAVSRLFKQLDFHITVFDNRDSSLTTLKNNRFAQSKCIIDFDDAGKYVPDGNNIYVIIMSNAHKNDSDVLSKLINKNIKYLGMMGSDKKVKTIFSELVKKGISRIKLENVDAPIGLHIHSQTPEEIAVSIAAQIIMVKNTSSIT